MSPCDAVLPHAALVVCHGGSGSTFGALAAGVPLVIWPLFADQFRNGRAVQAIRREPDARDGFESRAAGIPCANDKTRLR
jgi:hypothetical protein